jgi:hypothetical protein
LRRSSDGLATSPPSIEPDGPGSNLNDAEDSRGKPRIHIQARFHLLLIPRLDDKQDVPAVADRATENYEAVLSERIQERRVLVPAVLFAAPARSVPVPSLTV